MASSPSPIDLDFASLQDQLNTKKKVLNQILADTKRKLNMVETLERNVAFLDRQVVQCPSKSKHQTLLDAYLELCAMVQTLLDMN